MRDGLLSPPICPGKSLSQNRSHPRFHLESHKAFRRTTRRRVTYRVNNVHDGSEKANETAPIQHHISLSVRRCRVLYSNWI